MNGREIFFSQRLAGWVGQLFLTIIIFLLLAALGTVAAQFGIWLVIFIPLLVGYYVLVTLGWRRVLRSYASVNIYRYFVAHFLYIALLMVIEFTRDVTGLSTSVLGINLMIQSAVLSLRKRVWLLAGLLLLILLLYIPTRYLMTLDIIPILANLGVFAIVYTLSALLGLLVVREERARETAHRLDETNRKLAQYAEEIEVLSTLNERNRLAREIHDNLGHYLTAVNLQLELVMMAVSPTDERVTVPLIKAQGLTKEALTEIRRSISALRASPMDHRTLHEAIGLLVAEHQATGHHIDYQLVDTLRSGSPAVDMALYRITQEALTNIRKHAQASVAKIRLSYTDPQLIVLSIYDDGIGSDDTTGGFGLIGIQERIQLLGGTLTIDTAKGRGFSLRVEISS
jgi:signal transduction histidine kinase